MAHTVDEKGLGGLAKTKKVSEFNKMRKCFPERVNIVSEGDSWFAYPPKWLVAGPPSNLIDHISKWTAGKANFYTMASNGDEAVDMVSGKQKHDLVKVLRWHEEGKDRYPVDLLLFSGGGNDVVGKNDYERFLRPFKPGYTKPTQCVNLSRLRRKAKQIGLAYEELADIRDHYSPSTVILTHTYDYPYPSEEGGNFLGGLIKTKCWMKRFMDSNKIPKAWQADVIRVFMDALANTVLPIAAKRRHFVAVDTRETLKGRKFWLNEIHPTSKGFGLIADAMFKKVESVFSELERG